MSLSFFLVLKEAKKIVSFSLRGILKDVLIAVVGMMCVIGLLRVLLVQVLHFDALFLLMAIVVGGATYVGILYQIKGKALYEEVLNLTKGHTSS
jgi:hypothetical protein